MRCILRANSCLLAATPISVSSPHDPESVNHLVNVYRQDACFDCGGRQNVIIFLEGGIGWGGWIGAEGMWGKKEKACNSL